MNTQEPYSINLNVKFAPLEVVDLQSLVNTATDAWYNQSLCLVNDCVVRLGVVQGEFHWHKHDEEDEFFYVVEGHFIIDLEDHTIELDPRQSFTIPKGVMHRPRAPQKTVILMIEGAGVTPTGTSRYKRQCCFGCLFSALRSPILKTPTESVSWNSSSSYKRQTIWSVMKNMESG